MSEDCGCRVEYVPLDPDLHGPYAVRATTIYCPLHASAQELLEVVSRAIAKRTGVLHDPDGDPASPDAFEISAREMRYLELAEAHARGEKTPSPK